MWPALILTLLGTAVQSKEQKAGARRGVAESRRGREKQKGIEAKRSAKIMEALEVLDPAARQERTETKAGETQARLEDLLAGPAAAGQGPGTVGKISENVLSQRADAVRKQANDASILAALLSKIQAPGQAGAEEALSRSEFSTDVSGLGSEARRAKRVSDELVGLESRLDPTRMTLGGMAQGLGMSLASGQILSALNPGAMAATDPTKFMDVSPYGGSNFVGSGYRGVG